MMHPLKSVLPKAAVEVVCNRLHLKPETPIIPQGDSGKYRIAGTDDLLQIGKGFSDVKRVRRYFKEIDRM